MLNKAIHTITPFTLLDYPHKSACILWYAGCNMRCLYCYNPEIVLGKGTVSFTEVISFLKKRIGLLDAVVFSGGECLLHQTIVEHIKTVKEMGFLVKIDTNGSRSIPLKKIIDAGLVDYVALDFKALPDRFEKLTKSNFFSNFEDSFQILKSSTIPFEIRTTYHSELSSKKEIEAMQQYLDKIGYQGSFYVQNFVNDRETLTPLPRSLNLKTDQLSTSQISKITIR